LLVYCYRSPRVPLSFPTRRSSDLSRPAEVGVEVAIADRRAPRRRTSVHGQPRHVGVPVVVVWEDDALRPRDGLALALLCGDDGRSEEHTSELQSRENLVCRLLLEK